MWPVSGHVEFEEPGLSKDGKFVRTLVVHTQKVSLRGEMSFPKV